MDLVYNFAAEMIKPPTHMSFAALAVAGRKLNTRFFDHINKIINWQAVEKIILRYYDKGQSVSGCPAYSGLLLFKMCLLGEWYKLSDNEVEDRVNDCISFNLFLGLNLEDKVPDNSNMSRFRSELIAKDGWDALLNAVNRQLETSGVILKTGVSVDASITVTPLCPKGKPTYEIAEDRKEEQRSEQAEQAEKKEVEIIKQTQSGIDTEAKYLKKGKRVYYGYKKHTAVEQEGLVLAIVTTPANESDTKHLTDVLDKSNLKKGTSVRTDKGYSSASNRAELKKRKMKDRIMHKAARGKALSNWELKFNKLISKSRYKVERTFGGMVRWFGAGIAKYKGLARTHCQHILEAIAYNLYRAPGIIVSNSLKSQ